MWLDNWILTFQGNIVALKYQEPFSQWCNVISLPTPLQNLKSCMNLFCYQTLYIPHMWLHISINEQVYNPCLNVEKSGQKFMAHNVCKHMCHLNCVRFYHPSHPIPSHPTHPSTHPSIHPSIHLSGLVTAVAVFRNPNTIPFCLTTDLLLHVLFSWLLIHLPSTFFLDVLFFFFPLVSTP